MHHHPVFGTVVPEKGWVPAPRYLLRRHRIMKILRSLPRGEVLEIGCGAGALSRDLSAMGFSVHAFDSSAAAREIAEYVNKDDPHVQIYPEEQEDWESRFDYLMALEVLEHIPDDHGALQRWGSWLKPGGQLLLSVPCHPHRWNASDTWAGHMRRYERSGLHDLLARFGFSVQHFECYGVPLANIIDPIRARHHAKLLKQESADAGPAKHTARSGVERTLESKLYYLQASWMGTKMIQIFCNVQGWFSNTDMGNGYLVLARRK